MLPEGRWINQVRAFEGALDAAQRGVKRLCIASPTGSGKTTCMTDMIEYANRMSIPVALYTHRKMLFAQTGKVLEKAGIEYGCRASGYKKALLRDVQLCMIQTELTAIYKKKSREMHNAGIVLVDEAHQQTSPAIQQIIKDHAEQGAIVIGYTATPIDLGDCYEELLVAGTVSEMQGIGALVKAETFAPDEPDMKHVKQYQVGEDLSEKDNAKAIMRPGIFGRVRQAWLNNNPSQKPTILFAPDVRGSIFFAEEFYKHGIRAAHIDGSDIWLDGEMHNSSQEMRDHVATLSKAGEIKVVCNRFVLREGIDWPWIECGILASVFGSLSSYIQSGGRLLRACKDTGKQGAIVLDHGGNFHRHGSLNEDRLWELGCTNHRMVGERQEKLREHEINEPIVCPECKQVRPSGRSCPYCGHIAYRKSRVVVQIDGTLKQVEGDIYKPRRVRQLKNQEELWKSMYFRMKRAGRTFRQAEALYCHENHAWPPRDLPFMPKDSAGWWRKVGDVPVSDLIQKQQQRPTVDLNNYCPF